MYWQVHELLHVKFTCVFGCEITLVCKDFTHDVENHKKYFKSSDFFAKYLKCLFQIFLLKSQK